MAEKAKETEQMVQSLQQEKADAEERPAFLKDFLVYVMAGRNVVAAFLCSSNMYRERSGAFRSI